MISELFAEFFASALVALMVFALQYCLTYSKNFFCLICVAIVWLVPQNSFLVFVILRLLFSWLPRKRTPRLCRKQQIDSRTACPKEECMFSSVNAAKYNDCELGSHLMCLLRFSCAEYERRRWHSTKCFGRTKLEIHWWVTPVSCWSLNPRPDNKAGGAEDEQN